MKQTDSKKFVKQIDEFKKMWQDSTGVDLSHLDAIPNFIGKDEPIPFPYGYGSEGEDFGKWVDRPE